MAQRLTRRTFLVSAALTALPVPAFAQAKPVRMGLLTVKTGPLATGGIQMGFEDAGGRVVKKLWPPLVTPDYTPYLAQISGVDAVIQGFAGSNPLKFMKQYKDQGLKLPVLAGAPAGDDALLKSFGDEAIGMVSTNFYSNDVDTPSNKKLIDRMVREYSNIPGTYSAGLYISGMVAEAALEKTGGKTDDRNAFIRALRGASLTDTPRGPFSF